jgi:hypothetical protein
MSLSTLKFNRHVREREEIGPETGNAEIQLIVVLQTERHWQAEPDLPGKFPKDFHRGINGSVGEPISFGETREKSRRLRRISSCGLTEATPNLKQSHHTTQVLHSRLGPRGSSPTCWRNPRRSSMGFGPKIRFAPDSPLEGDGFEPSVPRKRENGFRDAAGMRSAPVAAQVGHLRRNRGQHPFCAVSLIAVGSTGQRPPARATVNAIRRQMG